MQIFLGLVLLLVSFQLEAAQVVKVGAYDFEPYYARRGELNDGLTSVAVGTLNKIQSKYIFEIMPIPPKRRYELLRSGAIDVILFEDKNWGWQKEDISFMPFPVSDGEVYIARNDPSIDESYFANLKRKHVVGFFGYHYACTNFTDPSLVPVSGFKFTISKDRGSMISMITEKKADIAILTRSYLNELLNKNSALGQKLKVSEKMDQIYDLGIIMNAQTKLNSKELHQTILQIFTNKKFLSYISAYEILKN